MRTARLKPDRSEAVDDKIDWLLLRPLVVELNADERLVVEVVAAAAVDLKRLNVFT